MPHSREERSLQRRKDERNRGRQNERRFRKRKILPILVGMWATWLVLGLLGVWIIEDGKVVVLFSIVVAALALSTSLDAYREHLKGNGRGAR